jgi:DNA-binding transcriptional LysR family regulator
VAIRFGKGNWPGLQVTPLVSPDIVVVGARKLIGRRDIRDPAIVIEMPWLQELGTNDVAEWMKRRGITPKRPLKITHMPGHLIMEALWRGDGLTYTARSFVREGIKSGHLVEVSSETDTGHYYIVTRPGPQRPPVRAFVKWLKRQASLETSRDMRAKLDRSRSTGHEHYVLTISLIANAGAGSQVFEMIGARKRFELLTPDS